MNYEVLVELTGIRVGDQEFQCWKAKFNPLSELVRGKFFKNNPGKAGSYLLVINE